MRKLTFVALAVVATGCSSGSESQTQKNPESQSLEALQQSTNRSWTWIRHDDLRMHLAAERIGAPQLTAGADVVKTTHAFLAEHRAIFGLRDPASELRLWKSDVDKLAMTHARFQQVVRGVPVYGAELTVHYDAVGRITSIDSTYVRDLFDIDVNPTLSGDAARAIVKADVLAIHKGATDANIDPSAGDLVVHAIETKTPALAYRITTRAVFGDEPAVWVTTVDAKTGAILERYNNLQTIEGSGTGVLGDTKKLQVTQSGGGYLLSDASRAGISITTYTAGSQQVTAEQGASQVQSNSATSWDTANPGAGAAVDAHYNAGIVYDYYLKVHTRNGIDGQNGAIMSAAHFGQAYDNAFWDGQSMSYGDGGQLFRPLSAGLDVGGHEFTHGVTQSTSNLTYQGQVGALNEAVSDIFGALIEHSVKPDAKNNWIMGENISLNGTVGIRDFIKPSNGQQPDNMTRYVNTQQDNGGVHINSGIVNNSMYLMTMGGTNPTSGKGPQYGIGWDKAGQLWYRVNSQYLQSTSNFASAAAATQQSAIDLKFTQNEQNIIDCAWKSTGVVQGTCSTISNPQSTTPPTTGGGTNGGTNSGSGDPTGSGPGASNSNGDGTGDGTGDGETTPAPKKHSSAPAQSSGCSVGPQGGMDLGPIAAMLAVVLGLARGRRKR
jgi:MYXO-CTERM domain-containing protein